MSDHRAVQRAIGEVLIPEARAAQKVILALEDSLPIALELFYAAYAIKPAYQRPALIIAERFAARMGLDVDDVTGFALERIERVISEAPSV